MTFLLQLKSSKFYILICFILIGTLIWYFKTFDKTATLVLLPAVTVTQVVAKSVAEKIALPGTLVSPVIVKVHPRVDGQILQVHFQNGDIVKKDQLLFTLDDMLLQTQLAQAEGSLSKDQANLRYTESEVKRTHALVAKDYTSASKFDQTVNNAEASRGSFQNTQGLIDQIKTQIGYTKIHSPIDGCIGYIDINEGNFVRATDANPLVTIVQLDPIEIRFSVPEKYLTFVQNMDIAKIEARLLDLNKQPYNNVGYLKTLDNQVDAQSGSILVAASFDNKDHKLRPGQYMTVEFALSAPVTSLILPINAVQIGQASSYVYVYNVHDQTVHYQAVQTQSLDDKTIIIKSGLNIGDTVIVSGQLKLQDRMKVRVISDSTLDSPQSLTASKVVQS